MSGGDPVEAFGRTVLGPVFAEFALRLHLLLLALERPDDTCLLFCARGGLRLRLVYQTFLRASGLECPVGFADLMVSRLVAARTALARGSADAYAELGREFRDDTLGGVLRALTQREQLSGEGLDAPFTPKVLAGFLDEGGPLARSVLADLAVQNRLFADHLAACAGPARRVVLADTGLYGSTLRLLQAGRPDYDWSCALFARSNYKGFSESHFPLTFGLCVESNGYAPGEPRTGVLRYWQLIESLLEPELPSVVRFAAVDGEARANLVTPGWEEKLPGRPGELFGGVIAYLADLPRGRAAEQIYADAPAAWRRLHDAIVWPTPEHRRILAIGRRSRDFGRLEAMETPAVGRGRGGVRELRASAWREGAVVERFPASRWLWLAALQSAHIGRRALAGVRRRPSAAGAAQEASASAS
jgi:hypothetical protein